MRLRRSASSRRRANQAPVPTMPGGGWLRGGAHLVGQFVLKMRPVVLGDGAPMIATKTRRPSGFVPQLHVDDANRVQGAWTTHPRAEPSLPVP